MYLAIRNPGVADFQAFTILGISSSRHSSNSNTIGQFGSGSKYSIALLLRKGIKVYVYCGHLKMEFLTKTIVVNGDSFEQVMVKYSGSTHPEGLPLPGYTKNSTDDLGFATSMGELDWDKTQMAFREFVSNAGDGALAVGKSWKEVGFEIVDKPRVKAGHTQVFIEMNEWNGVEAIYNNRAKLFRQFNPTYNPDEVFLSRTNEDKSYFYKKGVLINRMDKPGIFDYNLNKLRLNETRNANSGDIEDAVTDALASANENILAKVFTDIHDKDYFESQISIYPSNYTEVDKYKINWSKAWSKAFGDKAVICHPNLPTAGHVKNKGFTPITLNDTWYNNLTRMGIKADREVLSGLEMDGKQEVPVTEEMNKTCKLIWDTLDNLKLTNNKTYPTIKAFRSIMEAGSKQRGEYKNGTVYLEDLLGGKDLYKVALEEIAHHITGFGDCFPRDLQDWLFRVIMEVLY